MGKLLLAVLEIMFKSVTLGLFALLFSFSVIVAPVFAHGDTEESNEVAHVDTFDLFWPVSAGKVMGDKLYFLKSFKEKVRELFIFGNYQKADFNILLAEKRFAESEKLLLENKDVANFSESLNAATQKGERAFAFIEQAGGEDQDVAPLRERIKTSLEKQKALLDYWKAKGIENTTNAIDKNMQSITALLAKLQ